MDWNERTKRDLIYLAKKALWADPELKRELHEHGVNITPANFYSSVPLIQDIETSFEYRRDQIQAGGPYNDGGLFNAGRIKAYTERLAQFARDFDPPLDDDPVEPDGYFWNNPAFSRSDAMSYYCMLRLLKPRHVVEIGSGYSTLVADQALRDNGFGDITVIEPYPRSFLQRIHSVSALIERPVQQIPERELVGIVNSADVWFIDSTHTVKTGSDCLYIYLKIMPQVTSEVMCQSHDIYLPYAPPQSLALKHNVFWTEQYLLQAYLLDNPKARVVFGSNYALRQLPEASKRLMAGRYEDGGASLWYWLNAGARAEAVEQV